MLALIQKVNGFSMFLAVNFLISTETFKPQTHINKIQDYLNKLKSRIPYTAVINVSEVILKDFYSLVIR